jgi:hypothetical protein
MYRTELVLAYCKRQEASCIPLSCLKALKMMVIKNFPVQILEAVST